MMSCTYKKDGIAIIDNIVKSNEVDILKSIVNTVPQEFTPDVYIWNQIYSQQNGSALKFTTLAREVVEQIQYRILQALYDTLELPTLKIDFNGIAVSSRGFDYHADAMWPEIESHRYMGSPTAIHGDYSTYIDYTAETWVPNYVANRFYTTVLYLNSGFNGGQTIFPHYGLDVVPRVGRMVAFPCTKDYVHAVRPTTGYRMVFNTWYERVTTYADQVASKNS